MILRRRRTCSCELAAVVGQLDCIKKGEEEELRAIIHVQVGIRYSGYPVYTEAATVEHALSRYALETYDGALKLEIYFSDKSFTKFCIILFSTATMIETIIMLA